jgi:hypothetical protein
MLYKGLKTLDKLDAAEEAKRVIIAKVSVFISGFNFPKILLNSIKAKAF